MENIYQATDLWIDGSREEILRQLQRLLRIPSVAAPAEPGAPFGREIRRALDAALELCRSLGFRTIDLDGMIGCAEYGEGAETLGVLCHLDVVAPEGEWKHGPFDGVIEDGTILARGVQDDKGPAVASIYGLAAVKACGIPFRRKVRLLFGCDEECQMRCLQHYLNSGEPVPDISFSPDGEFPVVNGELHICSAQCRKNYPSGLKIRAGTAVNAVPGKAEAVVPLPCDSCELVLPQGFTAQKEPQGERTRILVTGAAAHASVPHLGKNAIQAMLYLLHRLPLPEADACAVAELVQVFGMDYYGQGTGLDIRDSSGRLTLNLGLLNWDEKGYLLDLDIRAPISLEEETIRARLQSALEGRCSLHSFRFSRGFYLGDDTELVSRLQAVFTRRYGKQVPSVQIGGGTYARNLPNAVSFGPLLPGKPDQCHMTNESMTVDDFFFNVKAMADAIAVLAADCGE